MYAASRRGSRGPPADRDGRPDEAGPGRQVGDAYRMQRPVSTATVAPVLDSIAAATAAGSSA